MAGIMKAVITGCRLALRPVNGMLIKKLKTLPKDHKARMAFIRFGHFCNKFEVRLNRALIQSSGLGLIPKISNSMAFEKGIEWFTEIFFFYLLLAGLAAYEMDKNESSRLQQVDKL
jgi:uncharacterized membrane protein SirB2